jgi:hypothetical protein
MKTRHTSHTVTRILTGILMLAMAAFPVMAIISEMTKLQDLLGGVRDIGRILGSSVSAGLIVGFFLSIPLIGLYLVIEPVVELIRRR